MLNKIDKELQYIKDVKNEIIRKINEAPDGSLRCATSKGYHQYYVGKNYIRSNRKEVAVKLAEKEYCLKYVGCSALYSPFVSTGTNGHE